VLEDSSQSEACDLIDSDRIEAEVDKYGGDKARYDLGNVL